jgi:hypothetical protein
VDRKTIRRVGQEMAAAAVAKSPTPAAGEATENGPIGF